MFLTNLVLDTYNSGSIIFIVIYIKNPGFPMLVLFFLKVLC